MNRQVPDCPFGVDDPCASIKFRTDAQHISISLVYANKWDLPGHHAYSSRGVVLLDNDPGCVFDRPHDGGGLVSPDFHWQCPRTVRTYEVVLPIADKVTFCGVSVDDESFLHKIPPEQRIRYAAYGESVTQGFMASDPTRCASYILAKSKGWQLVNLGYGGRRLSHEDARIIAEADPDIITFATGGNDCLADTPLSDFKSTVRRTLTEIRSLGCTAPIYAITPFNQPGKWKGFENQEDYREAIRSVVGELSRHGIHTIEGPDLVPDELEYFVDGVHPNDRGFEEMAHNLSALLGSPGWQ